MLLSCNGAAITLPVYVGTSWPADPPTSANATLGIIVNTIITAMRMTSILEK